jgi:hypothetical protein
VPRPGRGVQMGCFRGGPASASLRQAGRR